MGSESSKDVHQNQPTSQARLNRQLVPDRCRKVDIQHTLLSQNKKDSQRSSDTNVKEIAGTNRSRRNPEPTVRLNGPIVTAEEMASKNKNTSAAAPSLVARQPASAADSNTADLKTVMQEVQTSNRFLLKRLNQSVLADQTTCKCECHVKGTEKEMQELQDRVECLEKSENQKDTIILQLLSDVKLLKQALTDMKVTPMNRSSDSQKDMPYENDPRVGLDGNITDDIKTVSQRKCGSDKAHDLQEAEPLDGARPVHTDTRERDTHSIHTEHDDDTGEVNSEVEESDNEEEEHADDRSYSGAAQSTGLSGDEHCTGLSQASQSQTGSGNLDGGEQDQMRSKNPRQSLISKANFSRDSTQSAVAAAEPPPVAVVNQKQFAFYDFSVVWGIKADQERAEGRQTLKDIVGISTIFCVDISASMVKAGAWTQAQKFVNDYVSGLEEISSKHGMPKENLALVTFGHDTRVVQRLSISYEEFRQAFNGIKLGGPSPLYGGLMMTLAAALSTDNPGFSAGGILGGSKIFLITDGYPTQTCLHSGPDVVDPGKQEETRMDILEAVMRMNDNRPSFFVVPVGQADMEFIQMITSLGDGAVKRYTEGKKLSRRTLLTLRAAPNSLANMLGMCKNIEPEEGDEEQMDEIMKDHKKQEELALELRKKNCYSETDSTSLPPVGSRVRRGPDWESENQDNEGPGTVIGHVGKYEVYVEWDADGKQYIYRYGSQGYYDVLLVDEPRVISPGGKIEVGCIVKPSKDWRPSDSDIGLADRGVMIKVVSPSPYKIQVRWPNKTRGEYECDSTGRMEVQLCDASEELVQSMATRETKRSKNKNKNMPV